MRRIPLLAGLSLFATLLLSTTAPAQNAPLSGTVSSDDEGAMEGVLVSAKKTGTNITTTVVTDRAGHFSFPAGRLEPGEYGLRIRAIGYDLDTPKTIQVAAQGTTQNLKLSKTKNLASQMSNAEWINSIPGNDPRKGVLLNCVGCHTVERIFRSTHDADEFLEITLPRMQSYVNQSIPAHFQVRRAERLMEERGDSRVQVYKTVAEYLASINLSSRDRWNFQLEPMPRPGGRATKVIYTEYDLPRDTIEPHDVIVDKDGFAWYSNFGEQNIGKVDPKTGKVTEYKVPEHKPGFPTGFLALRTDRDGDLWLGNMYQATITKFDRKTEKFSFWQLPKEQNIDAAQLYTPEQALGLVKDGDVIEFDIPGRRVNLLVDDEELARRRAEQDAKGWAPAAPRERHVSPALKIFAKFAQSADKGAARKVD